MSCNFRHVPVKIQISLPICIVWSESSLGAFWIEKDAKFLHTNNEDGSNCVHWSESLLSTHPKVPFLTLWLMYFWGEKKKIEPAHDKTYKMACVPSEDGSALASAQSHQFSPSTWRKLGPIAVRAQWRLWSDRMDAQADLLLGAHAIL